MQLQRQSWLFIVDGEAGRLLECTRVPPRSWCHLEERGMIENGWMPHDRGGKLPRTGQVGIAYDTDNSEQSDRRNRFAKDITEWLEHMIEELKIPQVEIFSPPRLRGEMRKRYSPRLKARLTEHDADLSSMSLADLAKHPEIEALAPAH